MRVAIAALICYATVLINSNSAVAEFKEGEVNFVRNDRVLTWRTFNSGRFDLSENIDFNLNSNLSSSLNMATGSGLKDRWYDSVYNEAELGYKVNDKMEIEFTAKEDWNRDTFSKFGKSLLTISVDGNVKYRPFDSLDLAADVAQIYDRRFENEDKGTNLSGEVQYHVKPSSNFGTSVDISGSTSNLKRSHDTFQARSEMIYSHHLANVLLGFEDNRILRGYFSDVDRKGIEDRKRVEQNLFLTVSRGTFLNYRNRAAFEMSMALGNKRVDDSANNNEQSSKYRNNSEGDVKSFDIKIAKGAGKRVVAYWEAGYLLDDNNVERRNRSRAQTDISTMGKIGIGIGRSDSLSFVGWIKRTRIDTPIGVTNDRDELKFEGGVGYIRKFSNNLETGLDFRVLETHYVNIDASQSSQNKWIKSYQLSPSLVYKPLRSVMITHKVNLYANHMDYDFDLEANPRSNITRRVSSESWLNAELSSRTRISMGFMIENNDYGNLDRDNRKLPIEEGIRRFGDLLIEYKFANWITLSPMYVYAIRRDTDMDRNEIIRREVDQTFGINCSLFEGNDNDYHLVMSVKRIIRKTNKYPLRIRDYIDMNMRYEF